MKSFDIYLLAVTPFEIVNFVIQQFAITKAKLHTFQFDIASWH